MIVIRRERDLVELLYKAVSLIYNNIKTTRKNYVVVQIEQDYILLRIYKELNRESLFYDGKTLNFENFIRAIQKDTARWWLVGSKIKTHDQVKTILIKIMAAIRNIITRKAIPRELERFIKEEHGYNICNKDSINLLNFLINFKFYHDLNTRDFIDAIYPEIIEQSSIRWNVIPDPPEVIEAKPNVVVKAHQESLRSSHNQTRRENRPSRNEGNGSKNGGKTRRNKGDKKQGNRKEGDKQQGNRKEGDKQQGNRKEGDKPREEKKEGNTTYPFGAAPQPAKQRRLTRRR
jgi:hypothetical protein